MNNPQKRAEPRHQGGYVSPYLRQPVRRLEEALADVRRASANAVSTQVRSEQTAEKHALER